MSEAGVYLTTDTWEKVRRVIDSLAIAHSRSEGSGEAPPNLLNGWIKTTADLTTYDETTGEPVETDGYTYVYKGVMTWYDPVAQDWTDETQVVKVVGPNDEELSVSWRYYCVCWGEDGTVNSISATVADSSYAQDSDMNDVATIWMPVYPTHCQAAVKCDQDGPRTVYMQLPTEYETSTCTGETDEEFVSSEAEETSSSSSEGE